MTAGWQAHPVFLPWDVSLELLHTCHENTFSHALEPKGISLKSTIAALLMNKAHILFKNQAN
jgi:hypothetical protein